MRLNLRKRLLLSAGVLACATALAHATAAQNLNDPSDPPPPVTIGIDGNGVDLISGQFNMSDAQAPIGGGSDALARDYLGQRSRDNFYGAINASGATYTVSIGSFSDSFTLSGSTFTSNTGDGAALAQTDAYTFVYTGHDGSVATFSTVYAGTVPTQANVARIVSVARPDGLVTSYTYQTYYRNGTDGYSANLLQSVRNNLGYQIQYEYLDAPTTAPLSTIRAIQGINLAYNFCDYTANGCSIANEVLFSGQTATDALGRNTTYGLNAPSTTMVITRPSGATISVTLDASQKVTQVSTASGNWSYSYPDAQTRIITDPNGNKTQVLVNGYSGVATSTTDPLGNTINYSYDNFNRLIEIQYPEQNSILYTYDSRGNLTQTTRRAKPGSGLANITTSATYPATCTNPVTCNEPTATFDANGNETDYTYDPTHGGVLSVTSPAGPNGVRPQTRYSYTQVSAYYLQGGSSVAAGTPIYKLTAISTCATTASCVGASDEIRTTIAYGAVGAPNNLRPTSVTTAAGDGSVSSTATISYTPNGDVLTATNANGVTTKYVYDADREPIGIVGPDPDGSGPLQNRATRITYNPDGLVSIAEQGTVPSQADSDWANFSSILALTKSYDSTQRLIQVSVAPSGGSAQEITQYSYDAANHLICAAVRMNAAAFSSLPTSACNLGTTGGDGPDRIAYTQYDHDGRISSVTTGYGASSPRIEASVTYSPNGKRATVSDGAGNLTTYTRDGFDRLQTVNYPTPGNGSASNPSDYDQYTYDANSHRLTHRQRNGNTINYSYDALGRMTTGIDGASYSYDNLGRLLSTSRSGRTVSYGYDALSRQVSETSALGTMTSHYDAAGHRTQLVWPDSFAINYNYDATGAIEQIAENGATSGPGVLATYGYDNLGRRTSVSYGDGISSSYGYDTISRPTSLSHAFPNSANNVGFTLAYNEAGQINSRATSNSAFDWNTSYAVNRPYTANGLNQLTTSGSLSLSYAPLGNLTSDGMNSFTYDTSSNLVAANSNTLAYDPLNRVAETVGSSTTQFLYDGANLVAEYDGSGNLLRRYVDGPGYDQPIVWYQGSGAATRQWMLADPRNSVIAVADANGALISANTYDDYGVPGPANIGRFQYTGQAWIPEAGVYSYKARTYSPTLGRFMQTDSVGYRAGMNLYTYTQNDPINGIDPNGHEAIGLVVGAVVGGLAGAASAATTDHATFSTYFADIAGGAAIGGIGGALDPSPGIITILAFSSGAVDLLGQTTTSSWDGNPQHLNYGEVAGTILGGFVSGGLARAFVNPALTKVAAQGELLTLNSSLGGLTGPFGFALPNLGGSIYQHWTDGLKGGGGGNGGGAMASSTQSLGSFGSHTAFPQSQPQPPPNVLPEVVVTGHRNPDGIQPIHYDDVPPQIQIRDPDDDDDVED